MLIIYNKILKNCKNKIFSMLNNDMRNDVRWYKVVHDNMFSWYKILHDNDERKYILLINKWCHDMIWYMMAQQKRLTLLFDWLIYNESRCLLVVRDWLVQWSYTSADLIWLHILHDICLVCSSSSSMYFVLVIMCRIAFTEQFIIVPFSHFQCVQVRLRFECDIYNSWD